MSKKFEYYMVYGNVSRLPVAVIHKKNVKDREEAEKLASDILAKAGITDITLVEVCEDSNMAKPKGSDIHFCYYEDSYIDIKMVNKKQSAIIIHPDKNGNGIGFSFMDEKSLEEFVRKVNDMYLIHIGRK